MMILFVFWQIPKKQQILYFCYVLFSSLQRYCGKNKPKVVYLSQQLPIYQK